jgi:hypothetical protein
VLFSLVQQSSDLVACGRRLAGARGQASSPVFERPQDSPGRVAILSDEKAPVKAMQRGGEAAGGLDMVRVDRGLRVLPPVLADRPCDLDAMPKERRQLYINVPCCGGRGCPQCSLVSLGFR